MRFFDKNGGKPRKAVAAVSASPAFRAFPAFPAFSAFSASALAALLTLPALSVMTAFSSAAAAAGAAPPSAPAPEAAALEHGGAAPAADAPERTAPRTIAIRGRLLSESAKPGLASAESRAGRETVRRLPIPDFSRLAQTAPIVNNDVVRIDANGARVKRLQDESIRLARGFADMMLAEKEKEAGKVGRADGAGGTGIAGGSRTSDRALRDPWAARAARLAAEQKRSGGVESTRSTERTRSTQRTTSAFTIPGTTPEISARLHGPNAKDAGGLMVGGRLVYRTGRKDASAPAAAAVMGAGEKRSAGASQAVHPTQASSSGGGVKTAQARHEKHASLPTSQPNQLNSELQVHEAGRRTASPGPEAGFSASDIREALAMQGRSREAGGAGEAKEAREPAPARQPEGQDSRVRSEHSGRPRQDRPAPVSGARLRLGEIFGRLFGAAPALAAPGRSELEPEPDPKTRQAALGDAAPLSHEDLRAVEAIRRAGEALQQQGGRSQTGDTSETVKEAQQDAAGDASSGISAEADAQALFEDVQRIAADAALRRAPFAAAAEALADEAIRAEPWAAAGTIPAADRAIAAVRGAAERDARQANKDALKDADAPPARDTYIFISYSLGDRALERILAYASARPNVELVMRGLPLPAAPASPETPAASASSATGDVPAKPLTVAEGMARLRARAARFDPAPNIIIDPGLFRAYGVTAVPTVVRVSTRAQMLRPRAPLLPEVDALLSPEERAALLEDEARSAASDRAALAVGAFERIRGRLVPKLLGKVEGLDNAAWLNRRLSVLAEARKGADGADVAESPSGVDGIDFGRRGKSYPIAEPDLVEEMQRRALAVDWNAKKRRALQEFWTRRAKYVAHAQADPAARATAALPAAFRSSVRTLDPTVRAAADIRTPEGLTVRRAGEAVNPLEVRPFDLAVIVFNPQREAERRLLKARVEALLRRPGISRLLWIASEIDPERGWAAYEEAERFAEGPVFLLTPEVRDRWGIRATPTIVTADLAGKRFVIEELAAEDAASEAAESASSASPQGALESSPEPGEDI